MNCKYSAARTRPSSRDLPEVTSSDTGAAISAASDKLKAAIEQAELVYAELVRRADEDQQQFDEGFAANHERLLKSGHWGVPTFVYEGEPFYGQDRFDQLLWRMGLSQ